MDCSRRSLLLTSTGLLVLVGCSLPASAPGDELDHVWFAFKKAFLSPEGRIIDTGNGDISHTEGQGYGMVLAALAGDAVGFQSMFDWTEGNLARNDLALYAWRYDPASADPVADPNNATDGDLLIAWALLIAGKRWNRDDYLARSAEIRSAVREHLVVERQEMVVLLPGLFGFDSEERTTLNPAYYIWPALDAFQIADGNEAWGSLLRDGEELLRRCRFGPLALATDWVELSAGGIVKPADGRPPRFGFDAIRIPLYLSLSDRTAQTREFADFWKSYLEQKRPIPAWVNVLTGETAEYSLSQGGLFVVQRVTGESLTTLATTLGSDYYSAVLASFAKLPNF